MELKILIRLSIWLLLAIRLTASQIGTHFAGEGISALLVPGSVSNQSLGMSYLVEEWWKLIISQ